jgi:hypothetical protein
MYSMNRAVFGSTGKLHGVYPTQCMYYVFNIADICVKARTELTDGYQRDFLQQSVCRGALHLFPVCCVVWS